MTAEPNDEAVIDLLTAEGRQAIIDRYQADHRATADYCQQLEALIERFERDISEVDWNHDVAPVSAEALEHLLRSVRFKNTVSGRQFALVADLADADVAPDRLDTDLAEVRTAQRTSEPDENRLFRITLELGGRFRAEITRQTFTPPPAR